MQHAGKDALLEAVYAMSLPMRGRMIHSRDRAGNLITAPQDYDVHGRVRRALANLGGSYVG